jgi:hypothetical protein
MNTSLGPRQLAQRASSCEDRRLSSCCIDSVEHRHLTEDARLHAQVMDNAMLGEAVVAHGWSSPQIVLVGSAMATV